MDQDQLAQPIHSSSGPCGADLLFSAEFDEIQEARRFDDPSLSQGEWVTEVKEADWSGVVRMCETILANKSKDLRLGVWLTEAKCKTSGLPGLAEGYELLSRLVETYWDDIHPQPEEGDIEQRVGVLDWLANQTSRLIREIPLTHSPKGSFSLIDHESARATAKNIERNPGMAEELNNAAHVTLDKFDAALRDTPKRFFSDGARDAERLKAAIQSLQSSLDARMSEFSPAFGSCFDILEDAHRFFIRHAGEMLKTNTSGSVPSPSGETESSLSSTTVAMAVGPINSRDQAIHQLQEIAAFFRRTEPHSPVAYLAEKAAKWGSMPLHEWLRVVVKDDSALLRVEELLGVEAAGDATDSSY